VSRRTLGHVSGDDTNACHTRPAMPKPRIYGDEPRFRAALTRAIGSGEDLLAQADGYRERMKLVEGDTLESFAIEKQYEAAFRKWFMGTGKELFKYLQEQLNPPWNSAPEDQDVLPVLSHGLPPDDGKPRHSIGLDNSKDWLSKTLDELRDLAAQFPAPAPAPRTKASAPSRTKTQNPPGWKRVIPHSWTDASALVAVAIAVIGGIGWIGHATQWFGLTASDSRPWNDRIDTACLAGYGLMIDAEKKSPLHARLDAEAKAERDWVKLLQRVNVPVAYILDVNGYVIAKTKILQIREQIAQHGSLTTGLRNQLIHAQDAAQSIANYGPISDYLHVCGREALHLE
jgi:hypothetical protein